MRIPGNRRAAWAIFLGALALLLLNDFWFKQAGFLPGWVTGKLSDVAGLIVAPVTLALLLGRRRIGLYRVGFALIAVVFAAVELSPLCSDLLIDALGVLGLSWKLWPDPTDLLALAVLPLAWKVSSVLAQVRVDDRSRLMVVPAAAACLASGGIPIEMQGSLLVYNATDHMIALNIARVPWLSCSMVDRLGGGLIESADFGTRESVAIAPRAAYSLDGGDCGCGVYRLSSGGRSIVVRVPEGSVTIDTHPSVEQRRRYRDRMLFIGDDSSFAPGEAIQTVEVPDEAQSEDCGVEPPAMAFTAPFQPQYSFSATDMEVLAVTPVAGNCFGVKLQRTSLAPPIPSEPAGDAGAAGMPGVAAAGAAGAAAGDGGADGLAGASGTGEEMSAPLEPVSMYVCAPIELFPFTVGDVVIVNGTRGDSSERLNVLTSDRRFTLRIGEDPGVEFQVGLGTDSCGPVRGEDGPPWLTVPVAAGSSFSQPLAPGKLTSFEQDGGRLDVYLGRSRSVLGCLDAPGKLNVEIAERWSL